MVERKTVAVIDGQGGGVGKALVEKLRPTLEKTVEILVLGTNSLATSLMLKAGADLGATGENAVVVNVARADVILGPVGILAADAMLGELTPRMAEAIGKSRAEKVLIPINRCGLHIVGLGGKAFNSLIDEAVELTKNLLAEQLKRGE
ncbi:MAG: DUF3842 family protein [Planctomycetota bacterium]|jgi:predicted methyltransferase MtxX (methanogen marker protein 4)|nr:DUF3842 family protein [Planctomycetota bacterium]